MCRNMHTRDTVTTSTLHEQDAIQPCWLQKLTTACNVTDIKKFLIWADHAFKRVL